MITFTQGGLLRFVDPRTFGEMFVTEYDEIDQQVEELAHLGLDPLETRSRGTCSAACSPSARPS